MDANFAVSFQANTSDTHAHREWGRIGQGSRIRLDCFASQEQALAALLALEDRKRQRGCWVEPQQLVML